MPAFVQTHTNALSSVCLVSVVRTVAVANSTKSMNDPTCMISHLRQLVSGNTRSDGMYRELHTPIHLDTSNTGIICACFPMLKLLVTQIFPHLFRSTGKGSSAHPYSNSYALNSHTSRSNHPLSHNIKPLSAMAGNKEHELYIGDTGEEIMLSEDTIISSSSDLAESALDASDLAAAKEQIRT